VADEKTKQDEADRAKSENATNKAKQKIERKVAPQANTVTGEGGVDGGDTFPPTKVVPSQPDPRDDPELRGTHYHRDYQK
jgi:hypothetical protein